MAPTSEESVDLTQRRGESSRSVNSQTFMQQCRSESVPKLGDFLHSQLSKVGDSILHSG